MKTFYKTLISIYILTLLYVLFFDYKINIIVSLVLFIPTFYLKYDIYKIEYLGYVYLTQLLGSSVGLYNLPYYDKIMHFLSGIIFVIIGYILFKKHISSKKILYIVINCYETAVAFLWEVFEYAGLVFFNYDASRHFTTGVHDTMQDMIFSFIAGLLVTYVIYKYPSYIDSLYIQRQDNLDQVSQQPHT